LLIEEYFDLIERQLDSSPIVSHWTMQPEQRGRTQGYLRGDVHLVDGSRLHFREYVDVTRSVERATYAYQYMSTDQQFIFRYDNVAHHSHISTHPHHKHEGSEENVIPSSAPTLIAVLAEIGRMIQST
jgi:hypothetical protein